MTDPKKPPSKGSISSGEFEPHRPSLGPGPLIRLPPPQASIASMTPVKVPPKPPRIAPELPPEPAPPAPPLEPGLGALPKSLSTLASRRLDSPAIIVTEQPAPEATAPSPAPASPPPPSLDRASLAPPSLRPARASGGSRRLWLAVVAVLLGASALVVVQRRKGGDDATRASIAASAHLGVFSTPFDVSEFQRGQIHAHTTRSDGKQSPHDVAMWYRDHGYQFLSITDHDVFVDPAELRDVETPGFVLVAGEEISSIGADRPIHVLGLCIDHLIASGRFDTPLAALQQGIAGVRAQNGFAVVNHPNFSWAFGLADLTPLTGSFALEIWSGHPASHSSGDATHPSHEALWDELLTRGRHVTAVAVDDVHTLIATGQGLEALPGLAWIATFGELGRVAICDALRAGKLYASSGLALRRIRIEPSRFTVWVDDPQDAVEFVASASQFLANVTGDALVHDADGFAATYALHGGESFVRAIVTSPDGKVAWTQAYATNP